MEEDDDAMELFSGPTLIEELRRELVGESLTPAVSPKLPKWTSLIENHGKKVPVLISWSEGGDVVQITGSFNQWRLRVNLTKRYHAIFERVYHDSPSSDEFYTVLYLDPGTYEIRFVVDGNWALSTDISQTVDKQGCRVNTLIIHQRSSNGQHCEHDAAKTGKNNDDLDCMYFFIFLK